jgi:hypothetical protein
LTAQVVPREIAQEGVFALVFRSSGTISRDQAAAGSFRLPGAIWSDPAGGRIVPLAWNHLP